MGTKDNKDIDDETRSGPSSIPSSIIFPSSPFAHVSGPKRTNKTLKAIEVEMKSSIRAWDGPRAVFTSSITVPRSRGTLETSSYPHSSAMVSASGSASSPISIQSTPSPPSTSKTNLPRPRGIPFYTSPLPRTAYTPPRSRTLEASQQIDAQNNKPLHPFFNKGRGNVRTKSTPMPPPPTPHRPRMVAHYSSTSDSASGIWDTHSQSTASTFGGDESQSQNPASSQTRTSRVLEEIEIDEVIEEVERLEIGVNKSAKKGWKKPYQSKSSRPPSPSLLQVPNAPIRSKSPLKHPLFDHKTFRPPLKDRGQNHSPPKVVYTSDPHEANDLIACLKGDVLGLDMEWPVGGFQKAKGPDGKMKTVITGGTWTGKKWEFKELQTALIQICDDQLIILVHLREMSEPPKAVVDLVNDPKVYKTGVNIRGDGAKLTRDFPTLFEHSRPSSLLELSFLARKVDPINVGPGNTLISMANLCQWYLGHELHKGEVRRSDWSQKLTPEQIQYAADDVYASYQLYRHLLGLADQSGSEIDLQHCSSHLTSPIPPRTGSTEPRSTSPTPSSSGGYVKSPTPAQSRAFTLFTTGKSTLELSTELGIKETTVIGYIIQSLIILGPEQLSIADRKRLLDSVIKDSYPAKSFAPFLTKLRNGLDEPQSEEGRVEVSNQHQ